jgi:hypothetical protein
MKWIALPLIFLLAGPLQKFVRESNSDAQLRRGSKAYKAGK